MGRIDGPRSVRPIITGPISSGRAGNSELSISSIKMPGEINLKDLAAIMKCLLVLLQYNINMNILYSCYR